MSIMGFTPILEFVYCRAIIAARDGSEAIDGAAGYAAAQDNLGLLFAKGQGVPQDYVQAYMWFDLSAGQGMPAAVNNREVATEKMTPAQIAEAQKLASEWKPKPER